ncbi:SSI family serine proteinase inhibitor [Streptomyces sp. NPDC050703]|uniref:SSI family serine proteinase inhibitor n=1 Tax=Streptomyces sp. NPDC050703 TaxID=3157218 RepID=UPI003436931B
MRPLTVAVAALVALGVSVPAQAAGAPTRAAASDAAAKSGLFLTVAESDDTWIRGVLLHCEPKPAGRHPHAALACAEIGRAAGDLDALPPVKRPCTKKYDPVTASAHGSHEGRGVSWVKVFPNRCELEAATGSVFRF